MGGLFNAAMRLCDDCDRERPDLEWWGSHIRICPECRRVREQGARDEAAKIKDQADGR